MIPLPPAPPGAFCAPAGRRDPGRSPAALRAAKAGSACFAPASPGRAAPEGQLKAEG